MRASAVLLSRILWLRRPGQRYRFYFSPAEDQGLVLTTTGNALRPGGVGGVALVDKAFTFVFCTAGDPGGFLEQLSAWARRVAPEMPAVAALIGSGAAQVPGDPTDDDTVRRIDPATLSVLRVPGAWSGVAAADAATLASVLGALEPGERLWYWMPDPPAADGVPLLVQPIAADPNRDMLNAMIDLVEPGSGGRGDIAETATGIVVVDDAGRLQFMGGGLHEAMLSRIARWVRLHVAAHPGLARLADCRLLRTDRGTVAEVFARPSLWAGLPHPVAPATEEETRQRLAALGAGGACWFWVTSSAPQGVFLSLADAAADPDGVAFGARAARLHRRFPNAHADAIDGVVRRSGSGSLVFATARPQPGDWPALRQRLAAAYGHAAPGLAEAPLLRGDAKRSGGGAA